MVNQNQKGKRVERSIGQWLKGQGILSARRSEQYCGKSGDADILADELPSFHIECKGTKSAKLPKSILKKWYQQLLDDCKNGKLPVIFNEANGKEIVALIPLYTAQFMQFENIDIVGAAGKSFTPVVAVEARKVAKDISAKLGYNITWPQFVAFHVSEDETFLACNGEDFVQEMLKYEESVRVETPASRS